MIVTLLLNITYAIPVSINNVILIKKRAFCSVRILQLSGPAQDLSLFILQFIIRTCTCRPGIVSQYMYLTDSIEIKLMCHYYEQQPTNKTHSYM